MKIWNLILVFVCCGGGFAQSSRIDTNVIVEAQKIIGLEFTEKEREQMMRRLANNATAYEALRKESFPNDLAPAFTFRVLPIGYKVDTKERGPQWKPAKNLKRPEKDEDLAFLSVAELAGLIRGQQISSEELTRVYLERLKKYGPKLHCVVTLTEERALEEARRADGEIKAGKWRGPLHGIPYAAKDLLDTKWIDRKSVV